MKIYDSLFDSVMDSLWNDSFDSLFSAYKAPHVVKSICATSFPASNVEVNKDTKQFRITVSLPGLSENDIRLDREDNVLRLTVSKKESEKNSWRKIQDGFRSFESESELSWKIDTSKYDLDKTDVKLENGLLSITIEPTEVAKPKRIAGMFGKLVDKGEERKAIGSN